MFPRSLAQKGLWLWYTLLHIITYVYHAEKMQLSHYDEISRQRNDYIHFLKNESIHQKVDETVSQPSLTISDTMLKYIKLLFFPFIIIFFLGRKLWRFWILNNYSLCIKPTYSSAETITESRYIGISCSLDLITNENKPFPSGLVLFHYSLQTEGEPLALCLYIDPGTGFSDEYSIPLHIASEKKFEHLIELPPICRSLQLRVSGCQQEIKLDEISLNETNIVRAAWRHHKIFNDSFFTSLYAIFTRQLPGIHSPIAYKGSYAEWVNKFDTLTEADNKAIYLHMASFSALPVISLVLCIDNDDTTGLNITLKSLQQQLYPHWQLLLVKSGTLNHKIVTMLNQFQGIKQAVHIIECESDQGWLRPVLSDADQCDFISILNIGDKLAANALYMVAASVQEKHHPELIYSDHDYMDYTGRRHDPCFKPDWDYEFYLGSAYINGFVVYDSATAKTVADNLAQNDVLDIDNFQLRFLEIIETKQIAHIPFILIHRFFTEIKEPDLIDTRAAAVAAHLERSKQSAKVESNPYNKSILRINQSVPTPEPLISVIILTRNGYLLLSQCINGLLEQTDYKNIEIILIDNGSDDNTTLNYLDSLEPEDRVTVIPRPEAFNFSALNNFAVTQANGEYILLMNNDVAIIDSRWLKEMVGQIVRPNVGVVGAKLLYEDESLQHGGVIIGLGGIAGHAFRHFPRYSPGYMQRLHYSQSLSCVTAACLLTRKELYNEIGGLDEKNLKIAFNDVDYCLKVREKNYQIIWTPYAELFHLESASRGSDLAPENLERWTAEYDFVKTKWQETLYHDPYYNPNLTILEEDFSISDKPRLFKPWANYC